MHLARGGGTKLIQKYVSVRNHLAALPWRGRGRPWGHRAANYPLNPRPKRGIDSADLRDMNNEESPADPDADDDGFKDKREENEGSFT